MATVSSLLGERLARQGLAGTGSSDPCRRSVVGAAAVTTALQAQDNQAARLGVRARAPQTTDDEVVHALETTRTVARTWLLRGTIHLVPAVDLPWLQRLIGPSVAQRYRTRWRQLGLTDDVLDAVATALPDLLAAGPATRHEIAAGLRERGIRLGDDPQVPTHAVLHASTLGTVVRGPDRGRDSTFTLTATWLPDAPAGPSGDDALAELARRYFTAYSPATAADFATWSGLAAGPAVALVRDELTPCDVDGRPGFRLGVVEPARGVRLLPAFDNYLLGYRDRSALLAPERHPLVYRGGVIGATLVVDGQIAGTWVLDRARRRARLTVTPFEELPMAQVRAVQQEADGVARFLGREVELRLAEPV